MARFWSSSVGPLFFLTSQTKPGPNMAAAVAMKVSRKDSIEEKEPLMCSVSIFGTSVVPGHCEENRVRGVKTDQG